LQACQTIKKGHSNHLSGLLAFWPQEASQRQIIGHVHSTVFGRKLQAIIEHINMNKPQVFTLLDFFTFGLLALVALVAAIAVLASGVPLEAKALMTVVCLVFSGIYVFLLVMRKKSIDSCAFFTENGWGVRNNSSAVITKEAVDSEIQLTIDLWKQVLRWDDAVDAALKANYMIVFQDGIYVEPTTGFKDSGTVIASRFSAFDGQIIIAQMEKLSLPVSALKHEVGHIIYFGKYGVLDNVQTHKYMTDNKLP
jgi:hypothetical protein